MVVWLDTAQIRRSTVDGSMNLLVVEAPRAVDDVVVAFSVVVGCTVVVVGGSVVEVVVVVVVVVAAGVVCISVVVVSGTVVVFSVVLSVVVVGKVVVVVLMVVDVVVVGNVVVVVVVVVFVVVLGVVVVVVGVVLGVVVVVVGVVDVVVGVVDVVVVGKVVVVVVVVGVVVVVVVGVVVCISVVVCSSVVVGGGVVVCSGSSRHVHWVSLTDVRLLLPVGDCNTCAQVTYCSPESRFPISMLVRLTSSLCSISEKIVSLPIRSITAAVALVQLSMTVNVNRNPAALLNSSLMFQLSWTDMGDSTCASKSMNRGPNTTRAASSRHVFDELTSLVGISASQSWWSVDEPHRLQ